MPKHPNPLKIITQKTDHILYKIGFPINFENLHKAELRILTMAALAIGYLAFIRLEITTVTEIIFLTLASTVLISVMDLIIRPWIAKNKHEPIQKTRIKISIILAISAEIMLVNTISCRYFINIIPNAQSSTHQAVYLMLTATIAVVASLYARKKTPHNIATDIVYIISIAYVTTGYAIITKFTTPDLAPDMFQLLAISYVIIYMADEWHRKINNPEAELHWYTQDHKKEIP